MGLLTQKRTQQKLKRSVSLLCFRSEVVHVILLNIHLEKKSSIGFYEENLGILTQF